jgi:hypothetical protein
MSKTGRTAHPSHLFVPQVDGQIGHCLWTIGGREVGKRLPRMGCQGMSHHALAHAMPGK